MINFTYLKLLSTIIGEIIATTNQAFKPVP
jgi:hypothetical protein